VLPQWGPTRHAGWRAASTGHKLAEPLPRTVVPWRRPASEIRHGSVSQSRRWSLLGTGLGDIQLTVIKALESQTGIGGRAVRSTRREVGQG